VPAASRFRGGLGLAALERLAGGRRFAAERRLAPVRGLVAVRRFAAVPRLAAVRRFNGVRFFPAERDVAERFLRFAICLPPVRTSSVSMKLYLSLCQPQIRAQRKHHGFRLCFLLIVRLGGAPMAKRVRPC
jgi:hypothetical protein